MADPIPARHLKAIARHMRKHPELLRRDPLLLAGAMEAFYPTASLTDFVKAAEGVLGYPLLRPEKAEAPEDLEAEIRAALRDPDALNVKEAAALARVHTTTISRWCTEHGIGRKVGGRLQVSRRLLRDFLLSRRA